MNEQNIRLFVTDLDGTLLGDEAGTRRFRRLWDKLDEADRPLLCLSSGRLLDDIQRMVADDQLPRPDMIIGGVGTLIYDYNRQELVKAFAEILEEGWDLARVQEIVADFVAANGEAAAVEITRQPDHFQHDYKSSWYWHDARPEDMNTLEEALRENGLDVNVVYSSARHLDILPKWANKGNALQWLLRHLDIPAEEAVVAGDSGNDSAMFQIPGIRGIVVGNAQPELVAATRDLDVYLAADNQVCANGVIAGLQHFGLFPDSQEAEEAGGEDAALYASLQRSEPDGIDPLTSEQLALIRTGYRQAIAALKKNITPLGFSACSLDENETTGTDENYRSVWARDGSITLLGALPLIHQEAELRQCMQQSLETLLAHVSPNGQVPANVRIDDERPDYSGVGGIASIDSGIWLVIAFYQFVQATKDHDFLREHLGRLQEVMTWLSAHDSNNDSLLEIPEAGDWTDLFGRSYNVLYDEVLWYRCNLCFGRMLELVGDDKRAGDYFRWARVIKREILAHFWPQTGEQVYQSISFAEQQYSLGDARYLIAQVTPFDFSWRCDTFGNILAFLFDVIDAQKAQQMFRFMWGVGVNEPYPIANLYPVVHAGDKEWREYYTVNLLNLPHHYHNGGIWPFVGGMWVRFIHKLGLREVALQELYRLAELNRLGVLHEWEFNEWMHGRTGRPMGKAYQAWSASEYVLACHTLNVVA